jgi:hypothetical protein
LRRRFELLDEEMWATKTIVTAATLSEISVTGQPAYTVVVNSKNRPIGGLCPLGINSGNRPIERGASDLYACGRRTAAGAFGLLKLSETFGTEKIGAKNAG